jgi:transcriptional regulator with XRE-family HTH domain
MSLNVQLGIIPSWTVADRFRKAREIRGLSQMEMAEQTGMSRRTISAIETGDKTPGTKEFNLWQLITGVPRAWLETGDAPHDGGAPDGGGLSHLGESNPRPIHYMRHSPHHLDYITDAA